MPYSTVRRRGRRLPYKGFRTAFRRRYLKTTKRKGLHRFKYTNIARDVMRLKRIVNVEYKRRDESYQASGEYFLLQASATVAADGAAGGTPGYISEPVGFPAEGDDASNRDGRMIKLMSLAVKIGISSITSTSGANNGKFRFFIIMDKQSQAAEVVDPVPIMWNANADGTFDLTCLRNKDTMGRFSILGVRTVIMSNANSGTQSVNLYRKLSDHIRFTDTGGTSNYGKKLYIVGLAPRSVGNTTTPTSNVEMLSRLQWVDN